ncbi:MAG: porin family protein [Bacteroidales bacterium]|nr:porin family protein [Bacteroidales bacterium]
MINLPLKIRDKRRSMKDVCQKQCSYIVVVMLVGMVFPLELQAQQSVEVGILGGMAYYNGDINPGKPFVKPQATFGVLARYNFNDRWTVKGSFTHGSVTAKGFVPTPDNSSIMGVNFSTNIDELALTGEFNFWKYETGNNFRRMSPYIMGGGGLFHYHGSVFKDTDYSNYSGFSPALIFGFGFKYSLTKKLGLAAEWGMRKTFTDNLDNVSYPYATNLNEKDWYNFTVASLTYKIDLTRPMSCKNLTW